MRPKEERQENQRMLSHRLYHVSGRGRAAYLILCLEETLQFYKQDFGDWEWILRKLWPITDGSEKNWIDAWLDSVGDLLPGAVLTGKGEGNVPEEAGKAQSLYIRAGYAMIVINKIMESVYTMVAEWSPDTRAHDPNGLCYIDDAEETMKKFGVLLPPDGRIHQLILEQKSSSFGEPFDGLRFSCLSKNRARQTGWLKRMESELEKLETGDLRALLPVYCIFAVGDEKGMQRAGRAIQKQLEHLTLGQMIGLYERFRTFTSLEWWIDWSVVSLEPIRKAFHGEEWKEERNYVLILGTFHPNGYFRERCMGELAKEDGALPYLMLRANDWVRPIREKAFLLLDRSLASCGREEILCSLPVLEKLERSGRRSDEQLEELRRRILASLERQFLKDENWREIWPEDVSVRKSLYRMTIRKGILSMEQMDEWLHREKDSSGMFMLIRGILSHPDCTLEQAEEYLTYPNARIRRCALEYCYERRKGSWLGLDGMLLDSGRGVREYAAYILEKHTNLDIRGYYLSHLGDERPDSAILGLSECSHRGNMEALLPGLSHPMRKVQKITLLALGRQEDFQDEELLWRYLLDERADISRAACISIQKRRFYPGAEKLYHAYCSSEKEHQKRYLLHLLLRENSWERLPWLLRLYDEDLPEREKKRIRDGICGRFMYARVSEGLREEISRALKEKAGKLPEGMEEEICYDMRFVQEKGE